MTVVPMLLALALQVTLFHALLTSAQPPPQFECIPLAVKTPYLNGWIVNSTAPTLQLQGVWPNSYLGNRSLGWAGYVRVDNQPFQWMGDTIASNLTSTLASDITPTKSVFVIVAGPIQFNVTFFTPLEPNDYIRQSMPFSYMYIDALSVTDSQPHSVQMYSDISAQWLSFSDTTEVVWDTNETSDIVYHNVTQRDPQPMVETDNFAEDGALYYSMLKRSNLTWQTCADVVCRGTFSILGVLNNTKDTNFRPVNGTATDSWPVYAFSVDLGTISPDSQLNPIVSAIGLVRDPLIRYATESSVQNRGGYYLTQYRTPEAAITAFLQDFSDAQSRNSQLDNKIVEAATSTSPHYASILAFLTRQIFASMDITVPYNSDGSFNTSDIKIFMKDMSRSTRSNPVDVIYGAFPALLFFNSSIAAGLIEPLLESQSSPAYQNPYAAPDLGAGYPAVTGSYGDTSTLGVDSSSSLLIMAYAHAVKSGDGSLLKRYHSTLQKWADYLVVNALHPPTGSVTQDNGVTGVNLSNEALKGILGIYCMRMIDEALGVTNSTYKDQAAQLIEMWKQLAISGNHIEAVYGNGSSWGLVYNLFPAIWLNTSLIEDDIINNQAQFYTEQPIVEKYGFALDTTQPDNVYPHWTLWTAATIPTNLSSIRDDLIEFVYQRFSDSTKIFPLPMIYSASNGTGNTFGFSASAIHGAVFGILALGMQNVDVNIGGATITRPGTSSLKKNIGVIIGGATGGIGCAVILAFAIFRWQRRKRKIKQGRLSNITPFQVRPWRIDQSLYRVSPDAKNSSPRKLNQNVADAGQRAQGQEVVTKQRQRNVDGVLNPPPTSLRSGAIPSITSKQREASGASSFTLPNPRSSPSLEPGAELLRAEVEELRREMNTMRQVGDPPPEYG